MWSGPVGRSPVSIRNRAGSSAACSSMSASRTALRSRATAYVPLSSSCAVAADGVVTGAVVMAVLVVMAVGVVVLMVSLLSWWRPTGETWSHALSSGDMREAARGRLRISGWFDGPPQLGSHHARIGATVELMSLRVRD